MNAPFVVPHRRQFVIWDRSVTLPDWQSKPISPGQVLSWHRELAVKFGLESDEVTIGFAVGPEEVGRVVRLKGGTARNDPCGLASVYYGTAGGAPLVTSSPALVSSLSGKETQARPFEWRDRVNWYVLPGSCVAGFSRLLRDQSLDLATLEVSAYDRRLHAYTAFDEAVEAMADSLVSYLASLQGRRVVVALTAGLDSRTVLAAAIYAGVDVSGFTLDLGGNSRTDVSVARKICRHFKIPHTTGNKRLHADTSDDTSKLREHCQDAHSDAINAISVPDGLYRALEPDSLLLRATCFELGRDYYGQLLGDFEKASVTGTELADALQIDLQRRPGCIGILDRWLAWRREHDDGLSLGDSFYLDQRLGGWAATGELCHDALPALSLQPANSERIQNALLTGLQDERQAGAVQKAVISRLLPDMHRFPINPPSGRGRLTRLGQGLLNRVRRPSWACK
jgi:hypothetical protein